jgi:phospholipase C
VRALACACAFVFIGSVPDARAADSGDQSPETADTTSPIKHVIIIVGENRSFDHLFATYVPKTPGENVLNLLTEGIVDPNGAPGPNFAKGRQYQIVSAPNGGKYFISADSPNKALYATLPPPDLAGVGALSPYIGILSLPHGDPGLPGFDQFLFGTGGTGLGFTLGPDTRITNVNALPPGPFQMTGPNMPFEAFTGDTVHQYFQMYQQMDCAIDTQHVSMNNPTGCLHDLQSAVTTTYSTPPGTTPHDTGQTVAFFNMQNGDAPVFKSLAERQLSSACDGRNRAGQSAARLCGSDLLQRRPRSSGSAPGGKRL